MSFGALLSETLSGLETMQANYGQQEGSIRDRTGVEDGGIINLDGGRFEEDDLFPPTIDQTYFSKVGPNEVDADIKSMGGLHASPATGGKNVTGLSDLTTLALTATGLHGVAAGLKVFNSIKSGFDAYKDSKVRAKQLIESGEAEARAIEQKGEEVLRIEDRNQAQDIQESIQRGTNVGQANLGTGSALKQVLDANRADAERKAEGFQSHADQLRALRRQEANILTKKGKRDRTLGILSGLGTAAVSGVDIAERYGRIKG